MDKDWIGNTKTTYATLGASNHTESERETNDYYATSPSTVEKFLAKIQEDGLTLNANILEPSCGEGHISEVLIANGYNVESVDLIDRGYGSVGDFLERPSLNANTDILTNPPYKFAAQFVKKSLDLAEEGAKVVMFLKIQFLESKGRYDLFKTHPPKYVYIHSSRVICAMNGNFDAYASSAICYCWYIWEKGFNGEPTLRWIE